MAPNDPLPDDIAAVMVSDAQTLEELFLSEGESFAGIDLDAATDPPTPQKKDWRELVWDAEAANLTTIAPSPTEVNENEGGDSSRDAEGEEVRAKEGEEVRAREKTRCTECVSRDLRCTSPDPNTKARSCMQCQVYHRSCTTSEKRKEREIIEVESSGSKGEYSYN